MSPLSPHKKLTMRIYEKRDEDLFRWLQDLEDLPRGQKTLILKEVLRRGLALTGTSPSGETPMDEKDVQRAVTAALKASLDDIRLVVRSAVTNALNEMQVVTTSQLHKGERAEEDTQDILECWDDNALG